MRLTVAVLTSGGDAPGMNAAIAGVAERTAALGARAVAVRAGYRGLAEGRLEPLDREAAERGAATAGTWLGTSRYGELTDGAGQDACRASLASGDVRGLVVVGGNGSLAGARALADTSLNVAFVPATIDNDVEGTDTTLGFDSALDHAAATVDCLRSTARSLPGRAFVVQTLGGDTPHLAQATAAAAGLDLVLGDDDEAELDRIARLLADERDAERRIVVMHEGVGDASRVARRLSTRSGLRVHATVLGHAQRGAAPSPLDRRLGFAAGGVAAEALALGDSAFVALAPSGEATATQLVPDADPGDLSPRTPWSVDVSV